LPTERSKAVIDALEAHVAGKEPRAVRAGRAAGVIRHAGGYRWVGLYDVTEDEIAVIAWSGPTAPSHPRFHRSHGLNGAAVASRRPVVVQDVSKDSRYLPTLSDTRGELIMPVTDRMGTVVGTIDVESAEVDAFRGEDEVLLEQCAHALRPLWEGGATVPTGSNRSRPG
jgi:putative methionine-R-sulfoxide reductase with GAF domain